MAHSDRSDQRDHGAALLELFARGAELTRLLVDETERLRRSAQEPVGAVGAEPVSVHGALQPQSLSQLEALRGENEALCARLRSAEASNERWAARHAETERCHDDLANLFVASDQLYGTRDPDEVVSAISEIVINLIGAEDFALYAFDPQTERLTPFTGEGRALAGRAAVALGEGVVGRAVAQGSVWVAATGSPDRSVGDADQPIVVIPLRARGSALGAIAIFKLLDQKAGLSELDHQLFDLLAQHASTALHFARMQQPAWNAARRSLRPIDRNTN